MADFGDNPFGDPSKNPFSDPSVQQARSGGSSGTQYQVPSAGPATGGSSLQDFSPFEGKSASSQQQPAVLPTSSQSQPPPYSPSIQSPQPAQPRISTDELEKRQRELEAKARELERREEEHRQREQQLSSSGQRANNWPPLPSFSPVGPCFYQDIDLEIPLEFGRLVRLAYYLWMAHVSVLLINIIGALAYFIAVQEGKAVAGAVFGVSLVVCIAFTPASFVCWFRPLYKAFKNDSSFNFFLFFVMHFAQFAVLVTQCLGLDYLGSCGWINSFVMMKQNVPVAVFMLLIAIGFTAIAALDLILLIRVHRIYRGTGASFAKARQEFSQGVLTNEAVRGAAADAAMSGARSAFTGGGSGGGRY